MPPVVGVTSGKHQPVPSVLRGNEGRALFPAIPICGLGLVSPCAQGFIFFPLIQACLQRVAPVQGGCALLAAFHAASFRQNTDCQRTLFPFRLSLPSIACAFRARYFRRYTPPLLPVLAGPWRRLFRDGGASC